jgi:hypothetical protein
MFQTEIAEKKEIFLVIQNLKLMCLCEEARRSNLLVFAGCLLLNLLKLFHLHKRYRLLGKEDWK